MKIHNLGRNYQNPDECIFLLTDEGRRSKSVFCALNNFSMKILVSGFHSVKPSHSKCETKRKKGRYRGFNIRPIGREENYLERENYYFLTKIVYFEVVK